MIPRRVVLALSAAAAGAGGLGAETLQLSCAGLALGYGRSSALGLSVWVAAWATGAFLAGRYTGSTRIGLVCTGVLSALLAPMAILVLLWAGSDAPGGITPSVIGLAAIAASALPQGGFLPLLARAWAPGSGGAKDVSLLVAANLLGCVAGARQSSNQPSGRFI